MGQPPKESESARKARQIHEAAWKIIDAEKAKRDAKTARLKAEREAAQAATQTPGGQAEEEEAGRLRTQIKSELKSRPKAKRKAVSKSQKRKVPAAQPSGLPVFPLDAAATMQPEIIRVEHPPLPNEPRAGDADEAASVITAKLPQQDDVKTGKTSRETDRPPRDLGDRPSARAMPSWPRLLMYAILFAALYGIWRESLSDPTAGRALPIALTIAAGAIAWFVNRWLLSQKRPPDQS